MYYAGFCHTEWLFHGFELRLSTLNVTSDFNVKIENITGLQILVAAEG